MGTVDSLINRVTAELRLWRERRAAVRSGLLAGVPYELNGWRVEPAWVEDERRYWVIRGETFVISCSSPELVSVALHEHDGPEFGDLRPAD